DGEVAALPGGGQPLGLPRRIRPRPGIAGHQVDERGRRREVAAPQIHPKPKLSATPRCGWRFPTVQSLAVYRLELLGSDVIATASFVDDLGAHIEHLRSLNGD